MHNFSPRMGELYYLRLLLIYSKGAESFADVKQDCETFRECCEKKGLLEDDKGTPPKNLCFITKILFIPEWVRCLTDASTFQMPKQLRSLFTFILVRESVANPKELLLQFSDDLSEDIKYNLRTNPRVQNNTTLSGTFSQSQQQA